jgi:hypothetical protein
LEKLLSLFEQSNFIDKEGTVKNYPYTVDTEELKLMTDILEYTASDPEAKKRMEIELEAWRSIEALTGGLREKLSIKELELEQEKQRAEKEKQRAEQLEQEKIDMIKEMIADGIPIEKIIKLTKIDKEFLKKHRLL